MTMTTAVITSIRATPKAMGSGLAMNAADSTSEFTLERSWPAGWRRCHSMGSCR